MPKVWERHSVGRQSQAQSQNLLLTLVLSFPEQLIGAQTHTHSKGGQTNQSGKSISKISNRRGCNPLYYPQNTHPPSRPLLHEVHGHRMERLTHTSGGRPYRRQRGQQHAGQPTLTLPQLPCPDTYAQGQKQRQWATVQRAAHALKMVLSAGLEPTTSPFNPTSACAAVRAHALTFVVWTVPSPYSKPPTQRHELRGHPSSLYTSPGVTWVWLGIDPEGFPRLWAVNTLPFQAGEANALQGARSTKGVLYQLSYDSIELETFEVLAGPESLELSPIPSSRYGNVLRIGPSVTPSRE